MHLTYDFPSSLWVISHLPSLHRAFGSIGTMPTTPSLPPSLPPTHPLSFALFLSAFYITYILASLPMDLCHLSSLYHTLSRQSPTLVEGIIMHTSQPHRISAFAHSENLRLSVVSMCMCTGGMQSLAFARKHFEANSSILGVGSYLENSRSSCSSPAFHSKLGKTKKVSRMC